jgi:hypothetical protein
MNERYEAFSSTGRIGNLCTARMRRIALTAISVDPVRKTCTQDHEVWLTHVLEKMETIKQSEQTLLCSVPIATG